MFVSIVITGKIAEAIISVARKYGFTPEEYIARKILEDLDPKTRIAIYIELFEKYLSEARRFTNEGDIPQASEKYWGAVTSLLNIVGELKNMDHYKHSDYWEIMETIMVDVENKELSRLFATSNRKFDFLWRLSLSNLGFDVLCSVCPTSFHLSHRTELTTTSEQ